MKSDPVSSEDRALPINRRNFLRGSIRAVTAAWLGLRASAQIASAAPAPSTTRYRISVCDWMILKRQKVGAFPLARELGADGVEVDMGSLGDRPTFDNQLADPAIRKQFLERARELGLGISSIAMSGFYAQSFVERPGVERMVQDCLDTMKAMQVKVGFLPLGVPGDLMQHPELRPAAIERLKRVAAKAEEAGVVLGIETTLDASAEVKLLRDIGSPAIKSYFNFANALQHGRDLHAELRTLGSERICQIHCTDQDGSWLENDSRLDLRKVKQTLDAMDWKGWLVVERSRDGKDPKNVKRNFGANLAYLRRIFQEER
jgi:L-ribulose-5-phosphate 3-epimerase